MLNTFSLKSESIKVQVDFRAVPRILGRFVQAAIDLYALCMVLYLLVRVLGANKFTLVFIMNSLIHLALLPSFALLPLMLRRRRWPVAGMLVTNVAAFLMLFGGLFLPKTHAAPAGSTVIKAMTYNIASYSGGPEAIVRVLRESGADIIGLQEVDYDHAARIERELGDVYPYRTAFLTQNIFTGKLLLSRYPILEGVMNF